MIVSCGHCIRYHSQVYTYTNTTYELHGVYCASLILNKENTVDVSADVLDLSIDIESTAKFKVSVYDKRDKYKFNVVRFSPKQSNIPERIGYNTFISQVLRFSKICNDFDSLKIRVINL